MVGVINDDGVGGGKVTVLARIGRTIKSVGLPSVSLCLAWYVDGVLGCAIARPPHLVHFFSSDHGNGVVSEEALLRRLDRFG